MNTVATIRHEMEHYSNGCEVYSLHTSTLDFVEYEMLQELTNTQKEKTKATTLACVINDFNGRAT
jgi:hypothetical protein